MALSLMFSANAAAEMLARQCGAVGIVTYDLPPYTQTTEVKVPYEWLLANWPEAVDEYEAYEAAAKATAANGRKVWECFMLGVNPTKADDDFKITRFWMEGGKPMFEFSHSTDGAGNSFVPRLKVKGKAELLDGWSDVPEGGNSAFRFFTVEVELP
jgi:hypothetical protein